jgi:hypothetical protein
MFRPEDIRARLQAQPFIPLGIIASEGLRYEVRHPDLVMVGVRDIIIGHDSPTRPGIYNQTTRVALIHIAAIEEILTEPSATNGTAD